MKMNPFAKALGVQISDPNLDCKIIEKVTYEELIKQISRKQKDSKGPGGGYKAARQRGSEDNCQRSAAVGKHDGSHNISAKGSDAQPLQISVGSYSYRENITSRSSPHKSYKSQSRHEDPEKRASHPPKNQKKSQPGPPMKYLPLESIFNSEKDSSINEMRNENVSSKGQPRHRTPATYLHVFDIFRLTDPRGSQLPLVSATHWPSIHNGEYICCLLD